MPGADATAPYWGSEAIEITARSLPALKMGFLLAHTPARGRLLEVGSGDGKVLSTVAAHKPALELYGCDVRIPPQPPTHYQFRQSSDALPFDNESMDVVAIFDVLEHVPDPAHMLAEVARVLAKGGRFIAFVPIEGETLSFYSLYRAGLGADLYVQTKEHVHAFTHAQLGRMLAEHFDVRATDYCYHWVGQLLDATFFAAARLPRIRTFWWKENTFYNPSKKRSGGALSALLNRAIELGNRVAWAESTLLAKQRLGAAGVLIDAVKRGV